jgi:hypothetical protein
MKKRKQYDLNENKAPLAVFDKMVDTVLSYRVPARTKKAKKRQRKRRTQRESSI